MGFNCLKARATSRRQFTFYHFLTNLLHNYAADPDRPSQIKFTDEESDYLFS